VVIDRTKAKTIRIYERIQSVFKKGIRAMKSVKILTISSLLTMALVLAGCGNANVRNIDECGVEAKRATWRPTGTGFYHPQIEHYRPSGDWQFDF